ncbi:hypothetical protein PQX77_009405 [Marasmius sp. AFHP31]|nr:hypothetical protein PQX77_009405 [Marasmius sp. AFHP31]
MFSAPSPPPPPPSCGSTANWINRLIAHFIVDFGLGSEYFAMCDRFVEDVTTPDNSIQFKKTSAPSEPYPAQRTSRLTRVLLVPPIGPSSPANSDLEGEIDLIIRTMERLSLDSPAPQSPANLASA